MFFPATFAPVMPSLGFLLAGLAPALSIRAWLKPEAVGSKKEPKAPSQSDRNPTLIVPPPPPPSWAAWSPPPPSSSSSSPQAVTTSARASMAPISASNRLVLTCSPPRFDSRSFFLSIRAVPGGTRRRWSRDRSGRSPSSPPEELAAPLPEAHQAAGRQQHDHEEDDPEDRVEALRPEHVAHRGRPLARVVAEQRVGQRAAPGALEAVQPADDRDDEDVDRLRQVDRTRRDAAVVPDRQHPREGRHERPQAQRQDPGPRHVEAERLHPVRLVAEALERQAEGRTRRVAQAEEDQDGRAERD